VSVIPSEFRILCASSDLGSIANDDDVEEKECSSSEFVGVGGLVSLSSLVPCCARRYFRWNAAD